jgi:hypothetical protein
MQVAEDAENTEPRESEAVQNDAHAAAAEAREKQNGTHATPQQGQAIATRQSTMTAAAGTQCTCFASAKVQILTPKCVCCSFCSHTYILHLHDRARLRHVR